MSLNPPDLKVRAIKTKSKTVCKNNQWQIIPSYLSRTLFVGSTMSGKSNLIYSLLSEKKFLKNYYDHIEIFNPNLSVDDSIKVLNLPKENLHENLNTDEISQIYQEVIEAKKIHDGFKCSHPRTLLVFDDCVDNEKFIKSQILKTLFYRSRHAHITVWIGSQYLRAIPKSLRANSQHIITLRPTKADLEIINEEFNDTSLDKKQFMSLIKYATKEPYSFLNINRTQQLNKRYMKNFEQYLIPQ